MRRYIPFILYAILWFLLILPVLCNISTAFDPHAPFFNSLIFILTILVGVPIGNIITIFLLIVIYRSYNIHKYVFDIVPCFFTVVSLCTLITSLPRFIAEKERSVYIIILMFVFSALGVVINHIVHAKVS